MEIDKQAKLVQVTPTSFEACVKADRRPLERLGLDADFRCHMIHKDLSEKHFFRQALKD
jgi:hypothetical protein